MLPLTRNSTWSVPPPGAAVRLVSPAYVLPGFRPTTVTAGGAISRDRSSNVSEPLLASAGPKLMAVASLGITGVVHCACDQPLDAGNVVNAMECQVPSWSR